MPKQGEARSLAKRLNSRGSFGNNKKNGIVVLVSLSG